ncbi:MAG TPA: hypothetical protein VMY87_06150 [Armatimonadota bacterium]|nr:hypothetical protein [Armatimonadota bacterium]
MPNTPDPWLESFRATALGWLLGPDPPLDRLPSVVFLPMENPDVYDPAWIADHAADLQQCGTLTLATVDGTRLAFSSPKFGAPAVAMAVDVFTKAGIKAVVGVGFCGALQPDVECGDLILPTSALRDEGASRHYAPGDDPAACSSRAAGIAMTAAEEAGLALRSGPIVTTDGILRETRDKVERWHAEGRLGVDMETAALYTVASTFGLDAIALLIASDNVYLRKQTDLSRLRAGWQSATGLALAFAAAFRTAPA